MLRMWRLSRRTGIPYVELVKAHLEVMRIQTSALERTTDQLRMANELHAIETDALKR